MIYSRIMKFCLLVCVVCSFSGSVDSKKSPASISSTQTDPTIEDLTSKQLEKLLDQKDYVAVYWCKCYPDKNVRVSYYIIIAHLEQKNEN
jgi:hypothetical protein